MAGQQNPGQARVIDPVLTTVARGYKHAKAVGRHLFPTVYVPARGGKVIEFDKTDFKKFNTVRAPGAAMAEVQFGHVGKDYAIADHGISGKTPIELMEEAAAVPGIDLGKRAATGALNILGLEEEREQALLATTAANYDAAHVSTLAGNSRWDQANSDPSQDIAAGVEKIRSAIGMRPNVAIIGGKVYDKALKHHAKIIDRIKHTSRDSVTTEILATLWDIENVFVGDMIAFDDDGDTPEDVWGESVVLAYTQQGTVMDFGQPSFGFTYTLNGTPMVEMPWYKEDSRSWMHPVIACYKSAIAGKDAGYLIRDILT